MLKKILFIASLCSLIAAAPAALANDDVAAVTAAAEKLRVQMVTPDKAQLGALVAEQLSYGHSGGKVDTKATFIDDLMTGVSDFLTISIVDQTVAVSGDVAIIRHQLLADSHDKGKDPGKVNIKILQIWQKQGGKWLLLARQAVRAS